MILRETLTMLEEAKSIIIKDEDSMISKEIHKLMNSESTTHNLDSINILVDRYWKNR